jgi:hypothetical protein
LKVDTVSCIEPVIFDSVEKLVEGDCRILHNMSKSRKINIIGKIISSLTGGVEFYYDRCLKKFI